eukprot:m.242186 g.242186  ORF g.242186 m.242186 type:complete len:577 (-) comp26326_c0_seq1:140-1870(-)
MSTDSVRVSRNAARLEGHCHAQSTLFRMAWALPCLFLVCGLPVFPPCLGAHASVPTTYLFTPAVVASTRNMIRTVGEVTKNAGPVLIAEHPWESSLIFGHSIITVGTELYLYYNTWTATAGSFICLATSTDYGKNFAKPSLGLVAFGNSTANNIVLALTRAPGVVVVAGAVFVDDHAGASSRYKMTSEHPSNVGMDLWVSGDGLSWHLLVPEMLPSWFADTQAVVYWDNATQEYLAYGRVHAGSPPSIDHPRDCPGASPSYREIGFTRTLQGNLSNWEPVKQIFGFTDLPNCVDVYNPAAVKAANAYLMLPSEFRHFAPDAADLSGSDGVLDIRLAISSDGQTFEYASEETFVERGEGRLDRRANGSAWHYDGDWDAGLVFAVRGYVETNTSLLLFYFGSQMTHGDFGKPWEYQATAASGIGRLTLRLNGWFSFRTIGSSPGLLTTTAIPLPPKPAGGSQLPLSVWVNALTSVRGGVRVEVLDASTGIPLAGYDLNMSIPLIGNHLQALMRWTDTTSQSQTSPPSAPSRMHSSVSVQAVLLKFNVTYAHLFSFHVGWGNSPPATAADTAKTGILFV